MRAERRRNDAGRGRLLERLAQERREELVFLAARLDVPFAAADPVAVGLGIGLDRFDEARLVDARHREHDRRGHHLLARRLEDGRARARGDVRIAGAVDDALREDCLAAGLAFGDDAGDRAVAEDRRHEQSMQHRIDAGFLHQLVGDPLEHFRVERVADRLGLGHGRAHRLGALLELDADPFAVDRLLVAIPGEALDADLRDISSEAAVALEQRGAHAGTGRRQGRRKAARSTADDENIRLVDDVDFARGFSDSLHGAVAPPNRSGALQGRLRATRRARTTRPCRRRSMRWCSCPVCSTR